MITIHFINGFDLLPAHQHLVQLSGVVFDILIYIQTTRLCMYILTIYLVLMYALQLCRFGKAVEWEPSLARLVHDKLTGAVFDVPTLHPVHQLCSGDVYLSVWNSLQCIFTLEHLVLYQGYIHLAYLFLLVVWPASTGGSFVVYTKT